MSVGFHVIYQRFSCNHQAGIPLTAQGCRVVVPPPPRIARQPPAFNIPAGVDVQGWSMMKTKMLAGIAALALLAASPQLSGVPVVGASPAAAQSVSVSFNLFYDQLEPHGVWVRHSRYNYVWCPTGVDARWRPYTNGRWVYLADYGWYFQSQEPFSWATYHYRSEERRVGKAGNERA